jgi:hypothetical protein
MHLFCRKLKRASLDHTRPGFALLLILPQPLPRPLKISVQMLIYDGLQKILAMERRIMETKSDVNICR